MKFPNLHIIWAAGKNLTLPDTLSRNTPPELTKPNTTVEIPQNKKFSSQKTKQHKDYNANTYILEYQTHDIKVICLPLSMILLFVPLTLNTKAHSGAEETYSNFTQKNEPSWIKVLCNDCITCQLNEPYSNQKQISEKQEFKAQSLSFNHRISFDTKGPLSPSSEGNSYIMVIVDAFTHYVALNPEPHCNAYYAYTTLMNAG